MCVCVHMVDEAYRYAAQVYSRCSDKVIQKYFVSNALAFNNYLRGIDVNLLEHEIT